LLALLAWIANTRDLVLGALGMLSYALGLGTLFWIVGTFAIVLPKSGRWMEMVKSVFGIGLCVMALYWIRDLVPGFREVFGHHGLAPAISLGALAIGVAIGAIHLDYHDPALKTRVRKTLGIVLATMGLFGVVTWLVTPPPTAASDRPQLVWREDFQAALAEARAQRRPFIIDFGASWCQACGELERRTFRDARVIEEGARFVAVRVDLSPGRDTPEKRELLRSYNQRGLPLVVLHDSEGREVHRVTQFVDADEFLGLLRDVH
jgi:thiol:disulfide interchange protein DsbD